MLVIYQFTDAQAEQVHQLYQQVWWANQRSLQDTKACIDGSQICIGLIDDDDDDKKLVGFTRVITDFIYKAVIFDVIVCDTQRSKGLGKQLIELIKQHPRLVKVKQFELYCLPEMTEFYAEYGFSTDVGGVTLMRCVND